MLAECVDCIDDLLCEAEPLFRAIWSLNEALELLEDGVICFQSQGLVKQRA